MIDFLRNADSEFWKNKFTPLLILLAVFTVYHAALFCGFVYDDSYLITQNPFIRDFKFIPQMFAMDVTEMTPYQSASGYYRPFSMAVLPILYSLFKLAPFGWHAFSLLLHALNSILIFYILRRLLSDPRAAFFGALVFAVHPVHVEAVVPVYNYMGVLSSCFVFGAVLAWMKYRSSEQLRYGIVAVLCYFGAVFSKEDAIVLPALLLVYDVFFFKVRFPIAWLKIFSDSIPFGVVAILYLAMRLLFVERGAALGLWDIDNKFNLVAATGWFERVGLLIQVYAEYLRMLVWPGTLTVFHSLPKLILPSMMAGLYSATIITALFLVWRFRRYKIILFEAVWFLITSFLISNLIPIGGLFAERLMYLPSAAFAFLCAWALERSLQSSRASKYVLALCVLTVLTAYSWRTWAAVPVWKNNVTLWSHAATLAPDRSLPHLNLAEALFERGEYAAAAKEYEIALRYPFKPWKAAALRQKLARCYGELKQYDRAIEELQRALKQWPSLEGAAFDIGWTYFLQNKHSEAEASFKASLNKEPKNAWFYFGLAELHRKKGDFAKSKEYDQRGLALAKDPQMKLYFEQQLSPKADA